MEWDTAKLIMKGFIGITHLSKFIIPRYLKNANIVLPMDIVDIILNYYECLPTFNKIKSNKKLKITNLTTIRKIENDNKWSFCSFGSIIANIMCNKFDIYIKIKSLKYAICIGYITSKDYIYNESSVEHLGWKNNKNISVGMYMSKSYNYPQIFDTNYNGGYNGRHKFKKFFIGDIFILSFDFEKNHFEMFHNDTKALTLKLNNKMIVPAFTLYHKDYSIQIIKYRLYA